MRFLIASVNVHCPRCDPALIYRHGQNPKGQERFRCHECQCIFKFQLPYTYQNRKPGVKEQIVDVALGFAIQQQCLTSVSTRLSVL
ncbi:hypothetical protein HW114_01945 [Serratia symbiotica]|uniref:Uncharacterized protein n=1 Tax=Serratia symbiotica TaxID=138074 RepID=A0A7D5NMX5_9GAMM|nr:hypothetical protein [Serratia symbiotica]MBQ0954838.1 hypothetical protein [Serratia symbiotica]QLH63848.1 hypothetical protein SYMBAF_14130 [Serratia symbiotica]QTP14289.1 hypothetical protein GPZ83_0013210 [Serratia symbiotica]